MTQSLRDVEMLTDIAIRTVRKKWERNFPERYSCVSEMVADREAIGRIAAEFLKHWLKKGIRPNDLEKKGGKA